MALFGSGALKLIQRQLYTCLSRPYGIILLIGGVLAAFIAVLHLGEVALHWSMDQYAAQFSLYHDNIASDTFQDRLCAPLPIDVVYTWVNGSDPQLIAQLEAYKYQLEIELNATRARQEVERQRKVEAVERQAMNCTVTSNNVTVCRTTANRTKARLKDESGSPEILCPFSDCLPFVGLVVQQHMPENTSVEEFHRIGFTGAKRAFKTRAGGWSGEFGMALVYGSREKLKADVAALKLSNATWGNKSVGYAECFLTTLSTLKRASSLEDHLVVKNLPENVAVTDVISFLNRTVNGSIMEVHLWPSNNSAVVRFFNKTFASKAYSTPKTELKLQEKQLDLSYGYLVWTELKDPNAPAGLPETDDISSASRFQDNEELRFSLRALEKNAPWIRNIYIVTNGQIPNWLNLNHPRIKVIAHKDIFINQSHLPTFSSPAIESHLFRIPGLSDRFLYLNDDVMFGQPIWPDDFYTHSRGHKVYLAWSVPQCNKGCPNSWLRDKYCDSACNTSLCDWDGGDCVGLKPGQKRHYSAFSSTWANKDKSKYCHSSCADTWIGDRYCDTACNVIECGFDAGDCEVGNYHRLWSHPVNDAVGNITVPTGQHAAYFNLSATFSKVTSGDFSDASVVRAAIVSQKFKVLTLVFNRNISLSMVSLALGGEFGNTTKVEVHFNLLVDTKHLGEDVHSASNASANGTAANTTATTPSLVLPNNMTVSPDQSVLFWLHGVPSHWSTTPSVHASPTVAPPPNISNTSFLPIEVQSKITLLNQQLGNEEITLKGYHKFYGGLIAPYKDLVMAEWLRQAAAAPVIAAPTDTSPATALPDATAASNAGDMGHPTSLHSTVSSNLAPPHTQAGVAATLSPQAENVEKSVDEKSKSDTPHPGRKIRDVQPEDGKSNGEATKPKEHHPVVMSATTMLPMRFTTDSNATRGAPTSKSIEHDITLEEKSNEAEEASRKTMAKAQEEWDKSPTARASTDFIGTGSLPWEQRNTFTQMVTELHNLHKVEEEYNSKTTPGQRHLMDTFADSLRHVNRLYNRMFGFRSRKVPAHMPHFIDKNIFARLHTMFAEEFAETSSHRLRSPEDMQFSFSYFYYMMSEVKAFDVTEVFNMFDLDHSGHLSHRELRTVALRLYEPLNDENMKDFEDVIVECWRYPNRSLEEANATLHGAMLHNATLCANCTHGNGTNATVAMPLNVTATPASIVNATSATLVTVPVTSIAPTTATNTATTSTSSSTSSNHSNTSVTPSTDIFKHAHESLPLPGNESMNDTQGLPTVTLPFFSQCHKLIKLLKESLKNETMHRHELFGEDDISFEMLPGNISKVAEQLDHVRRRTRKFICLNDNIDHRREEALVIKAMIREFYEALFPSPSQFELPPAIQNRFLHVDELREWQAAERMRQFWMRASVVSLMAILFLVYCLPKVRYGFRRLGNILGLTRRRARTEMKRV